MIFLGGKSVQLTQNSPPGEVVCLWRYVRDHFPSQVGKRAGLEFGGDTAAWAGREVEMNLCKDPFRPGCQWAPCNRSLLPFRCREGRSSAFALTQP